jgi:hypothetical protein
VYQRDDERVLKAFGGGEFDYVDAIGEVEEADFFRLISERKILNKLAASYPTPRERHDVPLWVYVASDLSMRFHGEHHFHAFPLLVRCGGLIGAFGPGMGHKPLIRKPATSRYAAQVSVKRTNTIAKRPAIKTT